MESNNGEEGSYTSEEKEASQQHISAMPVLPRLDRLDRLLLDLEEKRNVSDRFSADSLSAKDHMQKQQCKPLSSALEEVHFKGSLLERISALEKKVLQLSLELEEESTSSSCTQRASANSIQNPLTTETNCAMNTSEEQQRRDANQDKVRKEVTNATIHSMVRKGRSHVRVAPTRSSRKWLGWIQLGC